MRIHGWMLLPGLGVLLLLTSFYVPGGPAGQVRLWQRLPGVVPQRIVSLAPAITETLFALGAGREVVGVTDFCAFPPEAKERPRVGGYYDPNLEAVARLRPDLVVLLPEQREVRARLQRLGLQTLTVEFTSVGGALASFTQLGSLLQRESQAAALVQRVLEAAASARAAAEGTPPVRVLLVISRDYTPDTLQDIYVAGQDPLYHELLTWAGGVNVVTRPEPAYPKLSPEGVLALKPEIILDVIPDAAAAGRSVDSLAADWNQLPGRDRPRVRVLTGSHLVVPGPRLPRMIRDLSDALHPAEDGRAGG